jgi:hypothetical protein
VYPTHLFALSGEPVSDDDIRLLVANGCNAAELSAYTGHEPQHAMQRALGPCWWHQLRRLPERGV